MNQKIISYWVSQGAHVILFCLSGVTVQPSVKVSNQLVAAPAGSNVDIGCDVEASPKAMNSWFRETGKIHSN